MSEGPESTVWAIHRGRVRRGAVRSRLPGSELGSRFLAGRVPQSSETLTALRDTLTRCAPWICCYVGPRLWSVSSAPDDHACRANVRVLPDGRTAYQHSGLAECSEGWLLIAADRPAPQVLATLHHELWHAVDLGQPGLARGDVAAVDRVAARGMARPGGYLDSAVERRARLYESWASAADEGWRPPMVGGRPFRHVDRIFWYVYGGALARDVTRLGRARPQGGAAGRAGRRAGRVALALALVGWPLGLLWLASAAVAWAAR